MDPGRREPPRRDRHDKVLAHTPGCRDYVTPADVQAIVHDVFRHRIMLSYEAHAGGVGADKAVTRIVEKVAVA